MPIAGPTTSIDFTGYAGDGFDDSPDSGQLDSDSWRVVGMNDGDASFGDDDLDFDDFAESASTGNVTDGGLWAFTVAPGLPTCAITLLWGDDLPPAFPAHPHPPGDPRT